MRPSVPVHSHAIDDLPAWLQATPSLQPSLGEATAELGGDLDEGLGLDEGEDTRLHRLWYLQR